MDYIDSIDDVISQTEVLLIKNSIVNKGDTIVVLLGTPIFAKGTTNLMKIHVIGE